MKLDLIQYDILDEDIKKYTFNTNENYVGKKIYNFFQKVEKRYQNDSMTEDLLLCIDYQFQAYLEGVEDMIGENRHVDTYRELIKNRLKILNDVLLQHEYEEIE